MRREEIIGGTRTMLFGHNTNVTVGDAVYHVQTEDRGVTNALVDTTVFCRGRVLHRMTNNYLDLLPLDGERENKLKQRVQEQHRGIVEQLRSGALRFPALLEAAAPPRAAAERKHAVRPLANGGTGAQTGAGIANQAAALSLELVNAHNWLAGARANLTVAVRDGAKAVSGAIVFGGIEGAAEHQRCRAQTDANGMAKLSFDMPKPTGRDTALVIEASRGGARGALRFQLRAKAKNPGAR